MSGRILELRVHGVSNTPPAETLGVPTEPGTEPAPPRLVAGGPVTGFYRSPGTSTGDPIVVEAYSWGQLTSGARTARDVERALWTLLLPFTLANVALHARPGIPADPTSERFASRSGITAWLIRLFCLTLTATPVLALTGVGVDLIGWQCVDDSCLGRIPGPWQFLADPWWQRGSRALAVGLLVPLALIVVLGLVAWRTYQYEAVMPADPTDPPVRQPPGPADADLPDGQPEQEPPSPPEPPRGPLANPLEDPTFWWGEGQLRRAAVLHLCTGTVAAVAVPLGTTLALHPPHGARAVIAWPTVALLVAVVVITVVAIGRPFLTRRDGATPLGPWSVTVIVLTGLGLVGTVLVLMLPDSAGGAAQLATLRPPAGCGDASSLPGCQEDRSLPGFDRVLAWLGTGQLLLLIAIGATARSGRRGGATPAAATVLITVGAAWCQGWLPFLPPAPLAVWQVVPALLLLAAAGLLMPRTRPSDVTQPLGPYTDLAWRGRGPAVIAGFGWLLCLAYSTGLLYWVSDLLNRDATDSGRPPVVPPVPVTWSGLVFGMALLLLALVAIRAVVLFRRLRRQEYAELRAEGGLSAHDLRRARDVSTHQALHRLVGEHALRLIGWYAGTAGTLAALGCMVVLSPARPHDLTSGTTGTVIGVVADVGDRLLGWLPLAIAAIGLLVYRNDTVRRSVGVVWDVGTFWPRAAHPLAPPSYAERAVPELLTRTAGLLALTEHDPRRVDGIILSGHSQGTVICTAVILQIPQRWRQRIWFFSYGCQLTRLYGRIFPAYFGPDRLPVLTRALTRPSAGTRWTNFWRDTDPLGWPVTAGERDIAVTDPEALHPSDGEVADPPIRSHSGYPEAVEFQRERSRVAWMLRRAVPSPRRGVG
ncbi:hypothetical protein [Verrucosispora sp. NA02020]|uniref:hypothetical protein n=1 Tax=Verrucosispora sp. NA02020 TaxID=2742132 RepID=UPI0015922448|nr:hypothetical protein [Verrucosispora sp. NA02020]QKW16129.1 hypothetical protein HUT12_27545 [Verrucosispora sp. NA02020]